MNIVDNIDAFCEAKEMTRADLLRKLNLPSSTFSNWKRGVNPSADIVYKVAHYFNVPMEYVMYGEYKELDDDIVAAVAKLKQLPKDKRGPIIALINNQVDYWLKYYSKLDSK